MHQASTFPESTRYKNAILTDEQIPSYRPSYNAGLSIVAYSAVVLSHTMHVSRRARHYNIYEQVSTPSRPFQAFSSVYHSSGRTDSLCYTKIDHE
jgi:hypothetical protein